MTSNLDNIKDEIELIELLKLYIDKLEQNQIFDIIKKINDEEKLIRILNLYEDKFDIDNIAYIIESINNVDKKVELLNLYINKLDSLCITDIIDSIEDVDKKIELLNLYVDKLILNGVFNIIKSIKDEDKKIKTLELYIDKSNSIYIADIIKSIKDEDKKIKTLELYIDKLNLTCIADIIKSIKDEDKKIKTLELYIDKLNSIYIADIIKSITDENKKIKTIDLYVDKLDKQHIFSIIERISLEDKKLQYDNVINLSIKYNLFPYLHEFICHNDNIQSYELNDNLIKFYSKENSLNYDNLRVLISKFGNLFLRYCDNKNIKKLINSDKNTIDKILYLLTNDNFSKLDESTISFLYEALIKNIYTQEEPEVFSLFIDIKECCETKDAKSLMQKINMMVKSGLINFEEKGINIDKLIIDLLSDDNDLALNTIHEIVKEYKIKKTNLYFEERKKIKKQDLNLKSKYERNYFIKNLLENLDAKKTEKFLRIVKKIDLSNFDYKTVEFIQNESLLLECLKFKNNPTKYMGDINLIKNNLKFFNTLLEYLYDVEYKRLLWLQTNKLDDNMKVFCENKLSFETMIKILMSLDIEQMNEKLFNDEKLFSELSKILSDYKILGCIGVFEKLFEEAGVEFDENIVAELIKHFYKIYPAVAVENKTEKISLEFLISLLNESYIYISNISIYEALLGQEDYRLIFKNPGAHSAIAEPEERLKAVPDLIKKMYERKYITVPPISENIKIDKNKSLIVTIGNTTDTINLTYGERTGACMRILGHADSLLRMCLENENGFHVRITNPTTGNLVSRVSGFRNGNTVFLNELRYSLDNDFKSTDLINVVEQISKIIIEKTKDSKYPIENVIISPDFAMNSRYNEKIYLSKNFKAGYEYFYTDVDGDNAILIASSNEDGSIRDLKLGPENCEKYPVLRQPIKCLTNRNEFFKVVLRLRILNSLLKGENEWYDMTQIDINSNITQLYYGEDWYMALDENNNIIDCLYMERDLERTLQEIEEVKEKYLNKGRKGFVL